MSTTFPGLVAIGARVARSGDDAVVIIPGRRFEDADDSLGAAADAVREALALRGYVLPSRWADDQRDEIVVEVPPWSVEDAPEADDDWFAKATPVNYVVLHCPDGGADEYVGLADTLDAARELASAHERGRARGTPEHLYGTARASGNPVPGCSYPVDHDAPVEWVGEDGYYAICPVRGAL